MIKERFINYLRTERRSSEHTIVAYENDLNQFFLFAEIAWSSFAEVNSQIIRGWLSSLMEEGMSARTVNRKMASLSAFYKYLLRLSLVENNPTAKIIKPKVNRSLAKFLDEENLIKYLDLKRATIEKNDFSALRDLAILELLYATGIRVSELSNIKLLHLNIAQKEVKVYGKRNKERIIPLIDSVVYLLKDYREVYSNYFDGKNNFLFLTTAGEQMHPGKIYTIVHRMLTEAGFSGKRSPHMLRHSFATHMLNNEAEINSVKELLGHSSLLATQVYTHNTFEKLRRVHKKAHPRA